MAQRSIAWAATPARCGARTNHGTRVPDLPGWEGGRSYGLFAALTGTVRNDPPWVVGLTAPRGLPADVTSLVQAEYDQWEGSVHDASWLSAEEILGWGGWAQVPRSGSRPPRELRLWGPVRAFLELVSRYADRYGASFARVVFWFDS